MGKRGPPKKPTALRLIQRGNPRQRRLAESEPTRLLVDASKSPPHLRGRVERATWRRVAPQLAALRILGESDVEMLVLYCETYARYKLALAEVARDGLSVIGSRGGRIKHPSLRAGEEALVQMRQMLAQFGMSPSSRAGVSRLDDTALSSEWDGI